MSNPNQMKRMLERIERGKSRKLAAATIEITETVMKNLEN